MSLAELHGNHYPMFIQADSRAEFQATRNSGPYGERTDSTITSCTCPDFRADKMYDCVWQFHRKDNQIRLVIKSRLDLSYLKGF
jgi:hypothetical protein